MITNNVREHSCPERSRRNRKFFTLVELLVALTVAGIVLTVVLTLAFAMTTAIDSSDDTAQKQAQVRHATLTISELIKQCKLVCGTTGEDLAIWKSDDDNDGKIDITELLYIETGTKNNYIQLLDFPNIPKWLKNYHFNPDATQSILFKTIFKWYCQERYVILVKECSNAQFFTYPDPPNTEFLIISFKLQEKGVSHQYQISASLRMRAGHLLDTHGHIVSDDD
jgi:type II secretory pathway pseudopilin PulG